MKYALVVEWSDSDTFSTFFFERLETAMEERDRERSRGNYANVYKQIDE